jgi:hypothetical protein
VQATKMQQTTTDSKQKIPPKHVNGKQKATDDHKRGHQNASMTSKDQRTSMSQQFTTKTRRRPPTRVDDKQKVTARKWDHHICVRSKANDVSCASQNDPSYKLS